MIYLVLYYLFIFPYYKIIFKELGSRSRLKKILRIDGAKFITIKKNVLIQSNTWIGAIKVSEFEPQLEIHSSSVIGNFNHIIATSSIIIEESVLTADKVYISDNVHCYENINEPILNQKIKQLKGVVIGRGAWIGENVCIIGASVGRNSVIGANSVVTKDIPDFSVAVGSPAYIIKRYCFETETWRKTDKTGNFL
jgi:acetyltransferase-like isoleucine patch superfamily enzyme